MFPLARAATTTSSHAAVLAVDGAHIVPACREPLLAHDLHQAAAGVHPGEAAVVEGTGAKGLRNALPRADLVTDRADGEEGEDRKEEPEAGESYVLPERDQEMYIHWFGFGGM